MDNATTVPLSAETQAAETQAAGPASVVAALPRRPMALTVMVTLLGIEAALALGATIFLSMLAAADDFFGPDGVTNLRFAAGGTILLAIAAYIAARKAWRGRSWAWTLSAMVQLLFAIGISLAGMVAGWHPVLTIGLGLAAATMLVQSLASVRTALGQV
ncbi:MAG: hypothetical protein ACRDGV_07100 [Candidatus Limnocylindria bacterium]